MSNKQQSLAWLKNAKHRNSYWIEKTKNDVAVKLEKLIKQSNLTKTQFAQRINASSAYVTKMLRGDANLTIETMVKASRALDCELHIHIAHKNHRVSWSERPPITPTSNSNNVFQLRAGHKLEKWSGKYVSNH